MKIGIYLAYPPKTNFTGQGLSVYLNQLIEGFLQSSDVDKIIVACPLWSYIDLKKSFVELSVDSSKIVFLTTKNYPLTYFCYETLLLYIKNLKKIISSFRKCKKKKGILRDFFNDILIHLASYSIPSSRISNIFFFCLFSLFSLILLVFSPFLIAIYLLRKTLNFFFNFVDSKQHRCLKKYKAFLSTPKILGRLGKVRSIFELTLDAETKTLSKIINNNSDADIWYCPTVFWPNFSLISKTKIACFPDLSPKQFPVFYATERKDLLKTVQNCEITVQKLENFITYSQETKDILQSIKIDNCTIKVIEHSPRDLSSFIQIHGTPNDQEATNTFCGNLLNDFRNCKFSSNPYLNTFDFSCCSYIFYPTQDRPNKNLLNLIKAYEILLRKERLNFKLFLTADLSLNREITDYLIQKRLQYDVISFFGCDTQTLAALYKKALLVVNTSLYEGGFPFTFSEGLSVGTPSVMASNPTSLKFFTEEMKELVLFDPYSIHDIVSKVKGALRNLEQTYEFEMGCYKRFQNKDWSSVIKMHLAFFKSLIERS